MRETRFCSDVLCHITCVTVFQPTEIRTNTGSASYPKSGKKNEYKEIIIKRKEKRERDCGKSRDKSQGNTEAFSKQHGLDSLRQYEQCSTSPRRGGACCCSCLTFRQMLLLLMLDRKREYLTERQRGREGMNVFVVIPIGSGLSLLPPVQAVSSTR